jgi:hypothetical protein
MILWFPHAGRQEEFLAATEFEVLYGGAKGGAKTDSLIIGALRQIQYPKYKALIFRKTFKALDEVKLRTKQYYPHFGGVWNENSSQWTFPSGAIIELGFCETLEDAERYHGREFASINGDEITQIADMRVWTQLLAECRAPDRRIVRMMRCSANPIGPGVPWVKRRFLDRCGHDGSQIYRYVPDESTGYELTRRFVPSRVTDNPIYRDDPVYMAQLHALPDRQKRLLLFGDWSAAEGAALEELSWSKHWKEPFDPPKHWYRFAAFDWGFRHPWCLVVGVADEDGNVWIEDTLWGRRDYPHEIAARWNQWIGDDGERRPRVIHAGLDVWHQHRARDEQTPTIAEEMVKHGFPLMRANVDRVAGLNNLRHYLAWRKMGKDGADGEPRLKFMATQGNRRLFEQLEAMVPNPDNPEDVLKVDYDEDIGGGDDGYDTLRYLLAGRPLKVKAPEVARRKSPHFDRAYEAHMHRLAAANRPGGRGF